MQYYLLAEETEGMGESYGVLVESGDDMVSIPNITHSHTQITRLLELLMRGAVTPAAVQDVVDDWLLR